MTILYNRNRAGLQVNHKGQWLFLTGFYNEGYWQAQDHGKALTWIKNDTIKPDYTAEAKKWADYYIDKMNIGDL